MLLMIAVIFFGVFAVVALLAVAVGQGSAAQAKQVLATLDSALATESPAAHDQIVNLRKKENVSAIPWLNKKLSQMQITPLLNRLLGQANLNWTPGALILGCVGGFAASAWLIDAKLHVLPAAVLVGLVVGFCPLGWVLLKRKQRFAKFLAGLPEALELMVNGLRAGHSLVAAMGLVGRECADPVGSEFRACFEEQNYGLELKNALDNLLARMPLQDLRIVATAILIQKESGGNLSEVLDKTAYLIRERFRLQRQVRVHTAQGRLTGIILSLLPLALGIIFFFLNPKLMSTLWTDPLGVKLLWAGAIMQVLGFFIIQKIVDIDM